MDKYDNIRFCTSRAQGTVLCVRQFQQLKLNIYTKSRWGYIKQPHRLFFVEKSKNVITKHIFFTIYIIEDERFNRKIECQYLTIRSLSL